MARRQKGDLFGPSPKWEQALAYSILRGWITADFLAAWEEWVAHRREIRHPLTERGARLQLEDFRPMTPEQAIAAIRHSIKSGYRGIFPQPGAGKSPLNGIREFAE